jgi:DNA-binding response OmpR family regulator
MIEDEPALVAMLWASLERDRYRAVELARRQGGLAAMRYVSVDLIVVTWRPVCNGLDLLRMP